MSSIVIYKPQPNGSAEPPEHYFYAGSLSTLTHAANDLIPKYMAIDDSPSPNHYLLPYQQGWLLEFRHIGYGVKQWVVFAHNGNLYLDDGEQHLISPSIKLPIQFSRMCCFTRLQIQWSDERKPEVLWIYTPILRLLLRDPAGVTEECEPMIDLFKQLATPSGYEKWLQRWTSGIAHESPALTVLKEFNSSH